MYCYGDSEKSYENSFLEQWNYIYEKVLIVKLTEVTDNFQVSRLRIVSV